MKVFFSFVLLAATFLRFWKIDSLLAFTGDFGFFYLQAREMVLSGDIPLVSIRTSVPVFKQGALFSWLLSGALRVGSFHPGSGAVLTAFLGVVAVWGTYKLASEWFSKRVGIIAALLVSFSPLIVIHSRLPYHWSPIFPTTLLVAWSSHQAYKGSKKHFFLLGLWLSLLYQLELAAAVLIPIVFLTFLWQRVKVGLKDLFLAISGFAVGIIPLIIHDVKTGVFLQTAGFFAWAVTKIFEGISGWVSGGGTGEPYFDQLYTFLGRLVFPEAPALAILLLGASFLAFIYFEKGDIKKLPFEKRFIFLWFTLSIAGFILRGIVSEAYMPLSFFPAISILALAADKMVAKAPLLGWLGLVFILLVNGLFLLKTNFLLPGPYGLPLSDRLKVVDFIIQDTQGKPYKLVYRGVDHIYESGDNHYQYLLWWRGNAPSKDADLTYFIFEPKEYSLPTVEPLVDFGYAMVGKR